MKSLREGRANLTDAYATVDEGEVWLRGAHHRYPRNLDQPQRPLLQVVVEPTRDRKIEHELAGSSTTLVPLSLYFSDGYAKVEIALATGKREYDKRQTIAAREVEAGGRPSRGRSPSGTMN